MHGERLAVSRPPSDVGSRTVPGPGAVAGALVTASALERAALDPKVQAQVVKSLGDILPGQPVQAGSAAIDRSLPPASLAALISSAAVVAAGFDPAKITPPVPPLLWQDGASQLLVRVAAVHADLGNGTVQLTVPVTCDQTGDVDVTVTFVTGTPGQPAGGIATAEDHPRGPSAVVENWAEPLIAYAWQTVLTATSALSGAAGGDVSGRDLITAALSADPKGLTVTPMGRHAFSATGATQ
jgi:hypothetical protein